MVFEYLSYVSGLLLPLSHVQRFKTETTMEAQLKKTARSTKSGEKAQSPERAAASMEKRRPSKTWLAAMEAAKDPIPFDRNAVDQ